MSTFDIAITLRAGFYNTLKSRDIFGYPFTCSLYQKKVCYFWVPKNKPFGRRLS